MGQFLFGVFRKMTPQQIAPNANVSLLCFPLTSHIPFEIGQKAFLSIHTLPKFWQQNGLQAILRILVSFLLSGGGRNLLSSRRAWSQS